MISFLLILLCSTFQPAQEPQTELKPVAIIELFTSQGCSSCPRADHLLRQVTKQKLPHSREVYALSFHVNYWNRLGWTDPYSDEQYTERQRLYAQKMNLRTIYTPQMVVDGLDEFVGSSKENLKIALERSFDMNQKSTITILNLERKNGKVFFDYTVTGVKENMWLQMAITQAQVSNFVPRGENRNLTLSHSHVVRNFKSVPFEPQGKHALLIPEDLDSNSKLDLVLFSQDMATMRIVSAGKMEIP